MSLLDRLFPGFLDARRELLRWRPRHFRPIASAFSAAPPPLDDMPRAEMEDINRSSGRYFERDDLRPFWINKPFSDAPLTGWTLWRFGHLLTALDLRPGDRVLDFGCGTGWSTIMLARMGMDVVGMDVAPAAIEIGRETAARNLSGVACPVPRFELFQGDRIDVEDGYFDSIVVFDAFHHLPNPRQVLAEFARVLAPNCRLGIAEPGIGHAEAEHSRSEMDHGVLERDLDLEQLYLSGLAAGFWGMEVLVPGLHPHATTLPMRRLRWYLRGLSWLVPANQTRLAILRSPIALFWKGPHFLSSLHPRDQSARIRPAGSPLTCRSGESFTLTAEVTNTHATAWLREGRHGRGYVRLGAHLLDGEGRMIDRDYGRAALPHDMPLGAGATMTLSLRAPDQPGRYVIRLDMVNDGIGWFAEGKSATADVLLTVS
jgi:SAM-dependent methyltransferase